MIDSGTVASSVRPSPSAGVPAVVDGPATVVNPGLQQHLARSSSIPPNVDTEVIRRLFPSILPNGDDGSSVEAAGFELEYFRIEEQIGRGGMGAVFRAIDERLDRVVALKVLSPKLCGDASTVYRFRNEAKAAGQLDHENIARVHYTGIDKGVPFIAFEFVTGVNLRDLILQRGRLEPADVVNYGLQIASALRHTAAAGVVHRDIKPSNIIVTPSGRAKLVDLGLARKEYSESAPELTVAGTTLGTFDYISPEQARDPRNVDVRSDIYSLGCTMYHMLTGEPPYAEGTVVQKLMDRQDKSPPNPAARAPGIPADLAAIVQRMMAGRPQARQSSPEQLINDLMLVAGELNLRGVHPEGLVWKSASELSPRRVVERHLVWVVAGVLLFGLAFAFERFSRGGSSADPSFDTSPEAGNAAFDVEPRKTNNEQQPKSAGEGTAKRTKDSDSPGKGGVSRREPIRPTLLNDDPIWGKVAPGGGVMAALIVEAHQNAKRAAAKTTSKSAGKTKSATSAQRDLITILDPESGQPKSYANLESACANAKTGQVILLHFNGLQRDAKGEPIVDRPIKIENKSITLRPANGFKPVILFAGVEVPRGKPKTRMITLSNGAISISNVGFVLDIDESIETDFDTRWSLFASRKSDRIRLSGVHITLRNSGTRPAAVFEVAEGTGPNIKNMKMMKKKSGEVTETFEFKLTDCFIRTTGDAFALTHARPGQVDVRNSALVVSRSLFHIAGGDGPTMPDRMSKVDVTLEHVTGLSGRGVADFTVDGMLPGAVLPLRVSARDNIFASRSMQPFVAMSGSHTLADLRSLLRWEGEKNFYERYSVLWKISPDDSAVQPQTFTFAQWQTFWGPTGDVDPRQGGVVWNSDWTSRKTTEFRPEDLRLDPTADPAMNPAATSASDGTAAGADLSRLPTPLSLDKHSTGN